MREFDIEIEQKVILQSVNEYETHISDMELVKGNVETVMTELCNKCKGHTYNESYSAMMKVFVESYFAKAYENTKKMKALLEDALPRINTSLQRCAEFHLQLCCDAYKEPDKPAVGDTQIRNGGILAINYNKTASLIDTCSEIKKNGDQIRNEIQELINSVSGDVPEVSACDSELAIAYKNFKRIENLRTSFIVYKVECVALEGILQEGLASLNSCTQEMTPYDDIKGPYWMPEDELTSAVLAIDCGRLAELGFTEEQMDELRKAVHNEKDLELLQKIASGNYKEAFWVPPSLLSDDMKVALTMFSIELSGLCDYELEEDELSDVAKAAREEMKTMVEKLVEQGNGGQAQDYLELFVQSTSAYATATFSCVTVNGNYNADIEEHMNAIKDAMNTWFAVLSGIDYFSEASGYYNLSEDPVVELGEFGYEKGAFRCEVIAIPGTDATPDEVQRILAESTYYAGCSYAENKVKDDLVAKEEELEVAYRDIIIGAAIDKIPGDYNKAMVQSLYDDSPRALVDAVAGNIPILKEIYSPIVGGIEKINGLKKEIAELQKERKGQYFLSAFEVKVYSGMTDDVEKIIDDESLVATKYSYEAIDPSVAKKAMEWTNYGFIAVLEDDSATPLELLEKAKSFTNERDIEKLSDNEDLRNAVLYMIYGNSIYGTDADGKTIAENVGYTGNFRSIYDIPPEDMADAAEKLDKDYLKENYTDKLSTVSISIHQLWQDEIGVGRKSE